MTIGVKIQTLRKQKGMSQEQLAEALGVSRQAVSKWEAEQSVPDIDKIIAICDFFGVTTDYILRGVELSQPQPEPTPVYTYNISETEVKEEDTAKRKKSALLLAIAIMMYILCVIPPIIFEDILGVVLMFIMIAAATGIIVYRAITNSKDKKEEKEEKLENPVLKAVKSGVWAVATVIYLAISFLSGAWYITWLVFPITSAIVNIIEACFDLKDGENK